MEKHLQNVAGFMYAWTFEVPDEHRAEFLKAYGAGGTWDRFFRQSDDYLGTQLFADQNRPDRYLTVDYWRTRDAHAKFRQMFDEQFRGIDDECEDWTSRETEIGQFVPLSGPAIVTDVENAV